MRWQYCMSIMISFCVNGTSFHWSKARVDLLFLLSCQVLLVSPVLRVLTVCPVPQVAQELQADQENLVHKDSLVHQERKVRQVAMGFQDQLESKEKQVSHRASTGTVILLYILNCFPLFYSKINIFITFPSRNSRLRWSRSCWKSRTARWITTTCSTYIFIPVYSLLIFLLVLQVSYIFFSTFSNLCLCVLRYQGRHRSSWCTRQPWFSRP